MLLSPRSVDAGPRLALADLILGSARCVQGVMDGRSLSDCLELQPAAQRPGTQAISFHVMRRLGRARAIRSLLVRRTPRDRLLDALLLVALSLLDTALEVAEQPQSDRPREVPVYDVHTVVDQAVTAARKQLRPYRGLINGVLRAYIRQRSTLLPRALQDEEARWNYPRWWIAAVRQAWPDQWQAVLEAGNRPGPMVLRVNRRRTNPTQLLHEFREQGIDARFLEDHAICLPDPRPVQVLPGFERGWWSVQDLAAQRAGTLLPLRDGMRVLDACAAPGGKTAHLLEQADLSLLALDVDPARLRRVEDNLTRLGLAGPQVALRCADASVLDWWDGTTFDAVLADVPCTASGVVRRHPDIRWLRRPDDIARTAALQAAILDSLWQTVAVGGHLLFVTCSIFPAEGEEQARGFCRRHVDVRRLEAPGQSLPLPRADGRDNGDGFFYALFVKTPGTANNSSWPSPDVIA